MVRTALAVEREVDDTRSIWDMGASAKKKENQYSSSSRKKKKTSALHGYQGQAVVTRAKAKVNHSRVGDTSMLLASRSR